MARTVFWWFRLPPLRRAPRTMLSCFDGTVAVSRRVRCLARGSSAHPALVLASGLSLWRSTIVRVSAMASGSKTSTSPPAGRRFAAPGGLLARLGRRHEPRHVDLRARRLYRHVARMGPRRACRAGRPSSHRASAAGRACQRDERSIRRRRERDAVGLRAERQRKGLHDGEPGRARRC